MLGVLDHPPSPVFFGLVWLATSCFPHDAHSNATCTDIHTKREGCGGREINISILVPLMKYVIVVWEVKLLLSGQNLQSLIFIEFFKRFFFNTSILIIHLCDILVIVINDINFFTFEFSLDCSQRRGISGVQNIC